MDYYKAKLEDLKAAKEKAHSKGKSLSMKETDRLARNKKNSEDTEVFFSFFLHLAQLMFCFLEHLQHSE